MLPLAACPLAEYMEGESMDGSPTERGSKRAKEREGYSTRCEYFIAESLTEERVAKDGEIKLVHTLHVSRTQ